MVFNPAAAASLLAPILTNLYSLTLGKLLMLSGPPFPHLFVSFFEVGGSMVRDNDNTFLKVS